MVENINFYEKKIQSQNGEDGILEEIFNRIGTTNKFFVEFGVEEGLECNTSYLSMYKNWGGLLIEGSPDYYARLVNNYQSRGLNKVLFSYNLVTVENINLIFNQNNVPAEFDLLSIDIDGNDYWIWKELSNYKPRVVVIEYNYAYPPPRKWVMVYNPSHNWNGTDYFGASLTSLTELGKQMGYSLLGTDFSGVNAFFIRNDLLQQSGFPEKTPEDAYNSFKHGSQNGKIGHQSGEGPFLEI
ncbi:FkbM family methyltransferase [Cytobacillus massiliigabonensis]|uniref:FkbM family methyltransferase n=1 Tax=Cytobacillus massiliigabonensis TaxID=1871011 RepID=UPI000C82B4A8|nr:FkbM family methyltransferase [Cytobacillus massiliigabonensis]